MERDLGREAENHFAGLCRRRATDELALARAGRSLRPRLSRTSATAQPPTRWRTRPGWADALPVFGPEGGAVPHGGTSARAW